MNRIERKKILGRKFFTNRPEDLTACTLDKMGYSFTKRGYPDFTVYDKDGGIYGFIEVKPDSSKGLKTAQVIFAEFCKIHNIPFLLWRPEDGQEKIEEFLPR